jgi:hypothetical protein
MDQNTEFEAIKLRHEADNKWNGPFGDDMQYDMFKDRATLITLVESERARADKAEAELAELRTLIDCVVENCEASASSHQERIETIHRITSAYALLWESARAVKGEG